MESQIENILATQEQILKALANVGGGKDNNYHSKSNLTGLERSEGRKRVPISHRGNKPGAPLRATNIIMERASSKDRSYDLRPYKYLSDDKEELRGSIGP